MECRSASNEVEHCLLQFILELLYPVVIANNARPSLTMQFHLIISDSINSVNLKVLYIKMEAMNNDADNFTLSINLSASFQPIRARCRFAI